MQAEIDRRRGFCPSVWTPMESGDGLIVRVHPPVSGLTSGSLRALAHLASRYGNGQLEITRRANVQLRGVTSATLSALQGELLQQALVAEAPAEAARRLLWVDPLADLRFPETPLLVLAKALSSALLASPALTELVAKVGVLLDGDTGALARVSADVRLTLAAGDSRIALSVAGERGEPLLLGHCTDAAAPRALVRLLEALASYRGGGGRMRELVAERGSASLRGLLGELVSPPSERLSVPAQQETGPATRPARAAPCLLGFQRDARSWFGMAVPFGAADAATFESLATLSERFGDGMVRFAAARTVILTGVGDGAPAAALAAGARELGLLSEPGHPLSRVVACAGAPACRSAWGETRTLARELAELARPLLDSGLTLHVSGCAKSCAHDGAADLTLLHDATGTKLGLRADVAETAELVALPLAAVRTRLHALAGRCAKVAPSTPPHALVASAAAPPPGSRSAEKSSPMKRTYAYERTPAEIYRQSFSIIRAEARLARFSVDEERVAVRLIHTCGMVELADDLEFSPSFTAAATQAIRAGKPILCDANMIVSGVTRARLSAGNEVLCFLDTPGLPSLARELGTTRSAAALSLWRERLDGALVAIGNAPTALFRLLELFDESDLRPAAVIAVPVGFVGAAESKQALMQDGRVPSMIVRGRKGGSAMAVAAINALASDEE